ncbi:MAG: UDP-N-acetylmuramoyl-tripeptide--D-alanyl-D-alanine ligase, partial [Gemmatimonadota bacterium]
RRGMTTPFWTDLNVRRALGLPLDQAVEGAGYTGVSTDSRSIREGELFVALSGERFDGHDHVAEALAQGAAGAVVSRPPQSGRAGRLYVVHDTLKALGALAEFRRRARPVRVVAITGSSGKTTTKELVRAALGSRFRVHATEGNLNNRIGLPLTILGAPLDSEVLVLELGTSEPGEIATLTRIATPDVGVITTVGDAHLEGLGSREGVLREKLALAAEMSQAGRLVVGDEPPELAERVRALGRDVLVAGPSDRADAALRPGAPAPDALGRFAFGWEGERIQLGIPGLHGVRNALLALGVARLFDIPAAEAARGVETVSPTGMRGEIRRVGGLTLILDCYNANPQSVEAALDLLTLVPGGGGRVAILGSMLELGEGSAELHRKTLRSALGRALDVVVATGEFDRIHRNGPADAGAGADAETDDAAEVDAGPLPRPALIRAPALADAYAALRDRLRGDETILLKGSRGAAVEALLPLFERDFAGDGGGD